MKIVKQNLILITISLIMGVLLGIAAVLVLMPQTKQVVSGTPDVFVEDPYGNPVITGYFVDINFEDDSLFVETYDASERKDVVVAIKINGDTIFDVMKPEGQEYLVESHSYSDVFDNQDFFVDGATVSAYLMTSEEELPEAFLIEINLGSPFIFEPAMLDPL